MIGGRSAAFARGALTHSLLLPLAHKVRFRVLQHIVRPIAQHRLGEVAQDGLELLRYSDVHRCPFSRPDPRRRGLTPERCGSTTTKAAVRWPTTPAARTSASWSASRLHRASTREVWRRERGCGGGEREDAMAGARAFGTSGNARMHGCEQRELRRQSPTALCSDGASGAAHRGPCRSTWLRAYHPSHSHPSSLVSCLTVGRDASRDISASATLTQPLSLALMSPDGSDRERSPLEPVKDNILPVAGEPPPLELPDPLKGAQAIDDVPEELMQEADPESGDSAETLPSLASSSSSAGTSAGPVLAASDEALLHVQRSQPLAMPMKRDSTGMPTERPEFGLSSSAPAFASSAPAFSFGQPRPASLTVSRNEDDGAASAIQALLTATAAVTVAVTLALTGSP